MKTITINLHKNNIVMKIKEDATLKEIQKELKEKLPELKKFYKDEKTPITITGKVLKAIEMDEIQSEIQKELNVKVEFDIPRTLGLHGIKKSFRKNISTSETKFYKSSLRSGQRLQFEGSIVILGDVNDGAEVIAEDNIVVLGRLRGMAHAGARGNAQAIVAAHIIESSQIRIASMIKERSREEIENQAFSYAYVNEKNEIELCN